jgi:hypothetical protein
MKAYICVCVSIYTHSYLPSLLSNGYQGLFPWGKADGTWSWPPTSSKCRGQRMSGAILPLPQYSFMAWCSVKAQGQLYLYIHILCHVQIFFTAKFLRRLKSGLIFMIWIWFGLYSSYTAWIENLSRTFTAVSNTRLHGNPMSSFGGGTCGRAGGRAGGRTDGRTDRHELFIIRGIRYKEKMQDDYEERLWNSITFKISTSYFTGESDKKEITESRIDLGTFIIRFTCYRWHTPLGNRDCFVVARFEVFKEV